MASIVKAAPDGFGESVEMMNLLTSECLQELCYDVMQFLQYKIGAVKTDKWGQKIQKCSKNVDSSKVQSIINCIIYLYRAAATQKLSNDEFTQELTSSMVFTDSSRSALCNIWSSQGKFLLSTGSVQQTLGVGQLIDIQWKVGMAMSSDSCKNLNSPFVTLNLTVEDTAGNLKTHNLELTLAQFRNFTNQLKEISTVLETV